MAKITHITQNCDPKGITAVCQACGKTERYDYLAYSADDLKLNIDSFVKRHKACAKK